jgi:radical SAM superfamily enzyme YgiQ (UPF0313 family)
MKKVALLINPWIYDFKAFDFWSKPLGLLYLASILRTNKWEVYLVDCLDRNHPHLIKYSLKLPKGDEYGRGKYLAETIERPEAYKNFQRRYKRYGMPPEIFIKILKELPKPSWIFITSLMSYWYLGVFSVIKYLKEIFPNTPIILGGIYATLCYEHAQKYSQADFILPGLAEKRISELFPEIPQYSFSELPFPAFDLYHKLDYVTILTSRGCIFNCNYCAVNYLTPKFIIRSLASVINELEIYYERGVKNIVFYDDALLANPNFSPLLNEIIKRKLIFNFHTPNGLHPRFITEKLAEKMYQANFKTIYLSLETVNHHLHVLYDQKVNKEEFKQAVNYLIKCGFKPNQIHAYLLIGLPDFNYQSIKESIDFVLSLGVIPHLAEYSPIPYTKAFKDYFREELVEPLFHNNIIFPLLDSRAKEDIIELKKYLVKIKQTSLRTTEDIDQLPRK